MILADAHTHTMNFYWINRFSIECFRRFFLLDCVDNARIVMKCFAMASGIVIKFYGSFVVLALAVLLFFCSIFPAFSYSSELCEFLYSNCMGQWSANKMLFLFIANTQCIAEQRKKKSSAIQTSSYYPNQWFKANSCWCLCSQIPKIKRNEMKWNEWCIYILEIDLSFLCAASNTKCVRALNRNAKMMKTPNRVAVAAAAKPSKSTHCHTIERESKKCFWPNQLNFIYCCREFFMIFDHTTHSFSSSIKSDIFLLKKKSGHPTDEHEKSVGGKLIVAYCQLLYIWFEL